ncbi:DUF4365 domain-containing protein [Streptomyces sp. S1]|uniref:DUF4365 domain-containing protein n=1 Tax=Streptomyces sp. S1 TaxID=718288 RepID=UPI000EF7D472|nr:DUF4365 domain-containing protein [Streptomyces sp. S1]
MQVNPTHRVERSGVSWIEHLVHEELRWILRAQDTSDFGIDAQIEIVDNDTSNATGRLIGVQIKSGLSYFQKATEDGWWFTCSTDHTSYWLGHSLPVVVMIYHPAEKIVYWQHVSPQTVQVTGKRAKIHVPRCQKLVRASKKALQPLARSASESPALEDWAAAPPDGLPQREAYFKHLVSARLSQKVRGAIVDRDFLDHDLWDMTLWVHGKPEKNYGYLDVGCHIALPSSPAGVKRILDGYRGSILPLVIFYTGLEPLSKKLQHANPEGKRAPVFVVEWLGSGAGKLLDSAVAEALKWAELN